MDKNAERATVRAIYDPPAPWVLDDSETPDFLFRSDNSVVLGIEVTEFYQNESHARLRKITDYGTQLIRNGAYRHKDDKVALPVERVTYSRKGQVLGGGPIPAIVLRPPPWQELFDRLGKLMREKSAKCEDYLRLAPQIDLVIQDTASAFWVEKMSEFHRPFMTSGIAPDIIRSHFREILLLTRQNDVQGFIPLRSYIFMTRLHLFEKLLADESKASNDDQMPKDFFASIVGAMNLSGFSDARLCVKDGTVMLSFATIQHVFGGNPAYVDRTYSMLPESPSEPLSQVVCQMNKAQCEFAQNLYDLSATHTCCIDFFLPVRRDWQLYI
jgi:hypothetical protein